MYLLFDIGGTKTRFSYSQDGAMLAAPFTIPTPSDPAIAINEWKKYIEGKEVEAVAGGIAGVVDREKGVLLKSPNLKEWVGIPIQDMFEDATRAPVVLANDADLGGLGEAIHGAGKGKRIVAYFTISTGVGGTRIVNGKIDESAMGFEPGHQIIEAGGEACGCGGRGHLEAYVSGSALERRFGKKPRDITDQNVWDGLAKLLAQGMYNTILHWSPDIFILGGAMMNEIGIPLERVRVHLKEFSSIFPTLPGIEKARLGDEGGLYGALALVTSMRI